MVALVDSCADWKRCRLEAAQPDGNDVDRGQPIDPRNHPRNLSPLDPTEVGAKSPDGNNLGIEWGVIATVPLDEIKRCAIYL